MAEEESDKPFDASQRKIEEARKKGELPISQDLLTFGVYIAIFVYAAIGGLWSISTIGSSLRIFISQPDYFYISKARTLEFASITKSISEMVFSISGWLIFPLILTFLLAHLQTGLVLGWDRVKPSLRKISILKNAKQKFGPDGLFIFIKSAVKLILAILLLIFIANQHINDIVYMSTQTLSGVLQTASELLHDYFVMSIALAGLVAAADFLWERQRFFLRQRMSVKELKDELKESEGDPYTKQARRQKGREIADNRMLSDVAGATVVIVNPSHFAIALKWTQGDVGAPKCVAKGVDELAARIREKASEHSVPIYRDPPTARTLFDVLDIGEEVPVFQYQAVVAAIKFAHQIRKRIGYATSSRS